MRKLLPAFVGVMLAVFVGLLMVYLASRHQPLGNEPIKFFRWK